MDTRRMIPVGIKTKASGLDINVEARGCRGRQKLKYRFFRIGSGGERITLTGWMTISDAHRYLDVQSEPRPNIN